MSAQVDTVRLTHNQVRLALHRLRDGQGRPLLLLHGLGEQSPDDTPEWAEPWPGPVWALDFTGHGSSSTSVGGGYTAEILLADADHALGHLGEATVVGRGLGAYVALLLAGARPTQVRGAVLCDGPGLWGGATGPTSSTIVSFPPDPLDDRMPDPYALYELSRDPRPPDYVSVFLWLAVERSGLAEPIAVCAALRPPWLEAIVASVGVSECTLAEAVAAYAAV